MEKLLQTTRMQKMREYIIKNKVKSICIGIVIIILGYYTYKHFTNTSGQTEYVLGTVETNTIVSSLTESGQVAANHELDVKPQASANVVYVAKKAGDTVTAGEEIVQLDTTNAEKAVRDAQADLDSANLSLQKLQEPATPLALLQAQDAVTQANSTLTKAYDDGFNNVTSSFIDLPTVMSGVDGILHNSNATSGANQQRNIDFYSNAASLMETSINAGQAVQYATAAESSYDAALASYNQTSNDYKSVTRTSSSTAINSIINETYNTTVLVADAVKDASNLIQYYQTLVTGQGRTPIALSTTQLNTLSGYTNTINGDVTNLSNSISSIATDVTNVPESQTSLAQLQAGANAIDIQSAQLAITQKENALQDAKDNLAEYYVTAPFSGTLASVDVQVGDPADSGPAVATLIANEQVADINVNEVDAAKIKLGDKVTLTFDAINGLTLTGKVASIDPLGTVSSGVVNYSAVISFDSSDPRVKAGMSVSASIITQTALDVLTVPSSAVKTANGGSYVLAFTTPPAGASTNTQVASTIPPVQIPVQTGLTDNTNTEITSGLTLGQQIVTRVIAPTTTTASASTAPSLLGATTGNRAGGAGGGGAFRGAAGGARGN